MKPLMMRLTQGKDDMLRDVIVNMSQVCYIVADHSGSVLTFAAVINDEPAYLCVNETPDEIGKRSEWNR